MSGVTLQKVVKKYGELEVVHGIDLQIDEQEFVVLVGPSGCGKSTTLRMIAGLEDISTGTISIDGRVVNRVAPKDRDVAMVFQNYALYPHLDVAENIAFGLRIRRTPNDMVQKQVAEVAEVLGLTPYLKRKPADLSGGQRQRVAMGRAIVRRPKVFLFDEPLSNLDAKLRTQMRAEIKRLHKRLNVTSVYVTHDQVEAMTLADRIVVMHDGHIEQIGTPMELFMNPANTFVAGFLGSPPMNQLHGKLQSGPNGPIAVVDGQSIQLPRLAALAHQEGRDVIVGVRPEFVKVSDGTGATDIKMTVDLVETLGSEALLHGTVGGTDIVLKSETQGSISHLENAGGFTIEPELIRVFDAENGRAFSGQDRAI